MSEEEPPVYDPKLPEITTIEPHTSGIYEILEIKDTGECLFHKAFQKSEVDPQIFSGILIAVKDLAREIGLLEIEDITMRSLKDERSKIRYFFEPGFGCLGVVAADKKINKTKIRKILEDLHKIFLGKHFQKIEWSGNISPFEKFDQDVDYLLKERKIPPVPAISFDF